jgi:hypothetical protein
MTFSVVTTYNKCNMIECPRLRMIFKSTSRSRVKKKQRSQKNYLVILLIIHVLLYQAIECYPENNLDKNNVITNLDFVNFPGPISLPSWSVFDQAKALSFLLSSF